MGPLDRATEDGDTRRGRLPARESSRLRRRVDEPIVTERDNDGLEQRILIERPVSMVWDYVTDLPTTPEWRTTVREVTAPSTLAVGQPFAASTRVLGRNWDWTLEVTACEPSTRFAYTVIGGVAPLSVKYRLAAVDGGCDFTMIAAMGAAGVAARALSLIAGPVLRRETAQHLVNLKTRLESGD